MTHSIDRFLRTLLTACMVLLPVLACAQPAQAPLLTRAAGADPNILLMFDDSQSMDKDFLYQDSNSANWGTTVEVGAYGVNPPVWATAYAQCSPQVNRLYYDPAVQYKPAANADGSLQIPGDPAKVKYLRQCITGGDPVVARYKGSGIYKDGSNYVVATISASIASYPRSPSRTDCASLTACSYAEELQNYANWMSYHSTRMAMAKTALRQAFVDLPATFRLGWAPISTLSKATVTAGVAPYNASTRTRFYNWLGPLASVYDTPSLTALNAAGRYFSRRDSDGPWGTTPTFQTTGVTSPAAPVSSERTADHVACRRSFAILMTDGYYNDQLPISNVDNAVGAAVSSPGGGNFTYRPAPPFADRWENTLADVAMSYWMRDLRPDLDNNIKTSPGDVDTAFWQHMGFYAISLGLEGTLPQTPATLGQLKAGSLAWPQPVANTLTAVDDLWHATINGHGDMLNARNSGELTGALRSMVGQMLKASASQAGVAVSTINLVSGTRKFVPTYTTGDWTGNLIAASISSDTGNETSNDWKVESIDASTGLEAHTLGNFATRNIVVGTAATTGARAVAFTYPAMSAASLTASMPGVVTSTLIDYLRGDRSQEMPAGSYRKRPMLLGDIVNSAPTFVRPAIDYGYGRLPGTASADYAAFLLQKVARTEGAVFVGANDGMLHAFAENDGREVFAYVPRAVLPGINQLADKNYVHRYFVDGPMAQGDYFDGSSWQTAVVGTTGAGAKAIFALRATTPVTLDASSVLWEVNDGLPDFDELGNVLAEVRVGVLPSGDWAAIFGNGYYSKSGRAQLFVVNMRTGARIARIDTRRGPNNGLGGVRLVLNGNNQVIGAYAGDLLGNLWKFDLAATDPTRWAVGHGGAPFFTARASNGDPQPITASPFVMNHPDGGQLVAVATGKLMEAQDLAISGIQSAYGLRDPIPFGTPTVASIVVGTSSLVQHSVIEDITVTRTATAFDDSTSSQVITYYGITRTPTVSWQTQRGWYFNLPAANHRTIYPVEAFFGRLARIDTVLPNAAANVCEGSSRGYNYIVDVLTGASPASAILNTNGDSQVDASDYAGASGYSTSADGRDIVMERPGTVANQRDFFIAGSGGESTRVSLTCASGYVTCSSSRTIVRRSWRQLFLR